MLYSNEVKVEAPKVHFSLESLKGGKVFADLVKLLVNDDRCTK